jgi:hypothetical protein
MRDFFRIWNLVTHLLSSAYYRTTYVGTPSLIASAERAVRTVPSTVGYWVYAARRTLCQFPVNTKRKKSVSTSNYGSTYGIVKNRKS